MSDTSHDRGRGEIEDLLPWYANGRLAAAERRRVETVLASDPELARRLDLVREEMAETIAANEAIRAASGRALDRLMAAIDAAPAPARPVAVMRAGLLDRIGGFLADLAPRRLAYAAVAAVALVAIQTAVLGGFLGERAGHGAYGTASQGTAAVADAGPSLLVGFAPGATMEEIAAVLKRHGAMIVEGPKANGFFRLRLADGADAAAVAARMKAEGGPIGFVQAVP